MSKGEKKKRSDRATPDSSHVKLTADCSSSSAVSEHVGSPDEEHDAPVEFPVSITVSQSSIDQETNHEPKINKIPILSKIIVQRYEGDKCEDVFHGEGVAICQGGHVYKGTFANGLMHGRGEYTWADGLKYEGEFASNIPMGHGTYTWLDGSTYEGEVCCGIRHGAGAYKCTKTSTVYRGQWHQGKRHGKGTIYYNQEVTSWYEGDWLYNQREGWGVCCYPSGNIYEGQWQNNIHHGQGRMKWINLGQQYSGQWVNGVQHGHGTHTWILKRIPGSQYPLRNEYKGEFVQGMRHGKGTFFYSSGAQYSGDWKDNKKHGQGTFIFKNGCIYEGQFLDDRMAEFPVFSVDGALTPDLSGIKTHSQTSDGGDLPSKAKRSSGSKSVLGTDMVLNIQTLLNQMPESQRDQELRQVEFAVMRHTTLLREIYSFYSSLGHNHSPDNTFVLTRLQFWRFLKDCNVHQHGITLAQIDRLTDEDISPEEVHSPFSTLLLRKYLSCIIFAAYHIYHKHTESSVNVLEECFSRLMRQNIIPNAKNIKGPLFCQPLHAATGMTYIDRCWDIYQALCKDNSSSSSGHTMTARHFLWMFKDLGLFDSELTTAKVLEVLSAENPAIYTTTHSNLDLEINFLEFFEALLSCAVVKRIHGIRTAQHSQCELGEQGGTGRTLRGEMRDSSLPSQWNSQNEATAKPSDPTVSSSAGSDFEIRPIQSPRWLCQIQLVMRWNQTKKLQAVCRS
ncbi:radial spoke head 10 homolog B isoform X2 [Brachyhypopomus gauderio]|uniref:radial spoke head 10 homolog B isoform X2 n=1 Tax=Brachyhypopomus gauderio TaxID=698409 RepID=UPI00404199FF